MPRSNEVKARSAKRRLFSLRVSGEDWLRSAAEVLFPSLDPCATEGWVLEWEPHEADCLTSPWRIASAFWEGEAGRRMVFDFPQTTFSDLRSRIAKAGLTTVTAAGLWTEATRDLFSDMGFADALAACCFCSTGGLVAGQLLTRPAPRPPARRTIFAPTMRDVATAWRVRRWLLHAQPTDVADAILTEDGEVVHATGLAANSSTLEALRARVAMRARVSRSNASHEVRGFDVWSSLVLGRWSLVDDYEEGGRRYVLAIRNDPFADTFALTPTEARIIEFFVAGRSPKEMSAELKVSLAQVYALRARAERKLATLDVPDVMALGHQLAATVVNEVILNDNALLAVRLPTAGVGLLRLTDAERDIARDLLRAMPQREIARRRARSPRTIANQVQSIYRKFRVSNRTEFVNVLRAAESAPAVVSGRSRRARV